MKALRHDMTDQSELSAYAYQCNQISAMFSIKGILMSKSNVMKDCVEVRLVELSLLAAFLFARSFPLVPAAGAHAAEVRELIAEDSHRAEALLPMLLRL